MIPPPNVISITVKTLIMVEREAALREAARQLEMDTTGDHDIAEQARQLIARANGLRKIRLLMLRRAGLR